MRNVLVAVLACALLLSFHAVAQQAAEKASETEAAAPQGQPAAQEAQPVPSEKATDAEAAPAAGQEKEKTAEPAPATEQETTVVVLESEGTGPVAAFWFVLPGKE